MMNKSSRRESVAAQLTSATATALAVILLSPAALSDVKSCAQAHAAGQREVNAGHLRRASELFAACGASEGCPEAIRAECVEFYAQVDRDMPTVIFTAVDEQGRDLTRVKVYEGNHLLADKLDGRQFALDPGTHHFRFVFPEGEASSGEVLVREGEKNRVVSVRVQDVTPTVSEAVPVSVPDQARAGTGPSRRPLPASFWVASGIGAAALTSWGVFALLGHSQQSKVDECSPNCGASQRDNFDAMQRNYVIADVSLGLAAASAGVATWILLSPRANPASATHAGLRLSVIPTVSATGAGLWLNAGAL